MKAQLTRWVTLLAFLGLIVGIRDLFDALYSLGAFGTAAGSPTADGLGFIYGLFLLVVGVLSLAFAYGAWTLKAWTWTLGIVTEVLAILAGLYSIAIAVQGNYGTIKYVVDQTGGIFIALWIIFLLFVPDVKKALGRA